MPGETVATTRSRAMGRVAHSVATGFAGQLALVASGVILARSLGVHDRGRLAILVLTASVLSQLATMGVPTALTYVTARGERGAGRVFEGIRRLIAIQLAMAMAIQLAVLVAIDYASRDIGGVLIAAALVLTSATMFQQYGLAALQGARRFRAFNICRTIPAAGFSALAGAATLFMHIDLYLAIMLLAATNVAAAATTVATACLRRSGGTQRPLDGRFLTRFGLRALLNTSSPVETLRLDQAVVGLLLSTRALGLYVVAAAFTNLPRFVAQSVGMVAYPEVAAVGKGPDARRRIWGFVAVGTGFVLAIAVALEVAAGWLIRSFFGPEFVAATSACRVLIGAAALVGIRRILADSLNGLGKPQLGSYAEIVSWIGLALTLPLGAISGGLVGVAASLLVSAAGSLLFLVAMGLGHWSPSAKSSGNWRIGSGLARCLSIIALPVGVGTAIPVLGPTAVVVGLLLLGIALAAVSWSDSVFILVVTAVLTIPLTTVRLPGNVGDLSDVLFLTALLVLVLRTIVQRDDLRVLLPPPELRVALFLFLIAGFLSTTHARAVGPALLVLAKIAITLWVLPTVIAQAARTEHRLRQIALAFATAAGAAAVAAVSDLTLESHFQQAVTGTAPAWDRYSGLTGHPNDLGTLMAVGIALSTSLFVTRTYRRTSLIALTVCIGGLIASGSLAGTAAAMVGIVAALLASLRLRRAPLLAGVTALLIAAGAAYGVIGTRAVLISRLTDSPLATPSVQGREVTNEWAISEIQRDPLIGHGLDQVGTGPTHSAALPVIHNLWLQTWYVVGLIGVIAFAMYYLGVWRLRQAMSATNWTLFAPSAIAWLVAMLGQPDVYSRFGMFGVLAAVAAASISRSTWAYERAETRVETTQLRTARA
jgi:O-antigen/teichoic acid export membrane protein